MPKMLDGFDYRPDREVGSGGGHAVRWTRVEWKRFIGACKAKGGQARRVTEPDGTHTTMIAERINGRLDMAAEVYGL